MAFFLVCGNKTFNTSPPPGYENVTARCQNCGNFSARVCKTWEWFTVCFIPLIPFSLKPYAEVRCTICNFSQDLSYRQDILNNPGGGGAIPMQNGPPQGWNQQQQQQQHGQPQPQQQAQYKPPGNQYG